MGRLAQAVLLWPLLATGGGVLGCSEYQVRTPPLEAPEDPPEASGSEDGEPPEWGSCTPGWSGSYFNLTEGHADVVAWGSEGGWPTPADTGSGGGADTSGDTGGTPEEAALPAPGELDWFGEDREAFSRHDAHLEPGSGWFPVDEDLAGDPEHFAVRWRAWIRPEDSGSHELVVASTGPLWVSVSGVVLHATRGTPALTPEVIALDLSAGQKPITVHFAHLGGESGLRLRSLSDRVDICPPE